MKWFSGLIFLAGLALGFGSNILVILPIPGRSHAMFFDRLSEELVKRGHHVSYATAFPLPKKHENLTEIIYRDFGEELMKRLNTDQFAMRKLGPLDFLTFFPKMSRVVLECLMEDPALQELLKSDKKFDLVMSESVMGDALVAGFSKKFNIPFVSCSPTFPSFTATYLVGNPMLTGSVPDLMLGGSAPMTFGGRVANILGGVLFEAMNHFLFASTQDELMRKYFGNDLPHISEIMKNTSLLLVNYDDSFSYPRPYVPNMVNVGGMHVRPPKPLPADLKKYFDESKNGVIFFSLGSHIKSEKMPKEMIPMFVRAFSKLPYDVLWKFEADSLPNQPKNLRIAKWLPQSDLLAHPNLKLFITHGGIFSTTEALYRGVPVVGIPILGDQKSNMKEAERMGFGKALEFDEITEEDLINTVNEVITNPKYREVVKERSEIFRDQMVSPLDRAMYHIEYVIRHKGAKHRRALVQDLNWIQYYCLDVILAIFGTLYVGLLISCKVTKFVICKLFLKKKKAKKD